MGYEQWQSTSAAVGGCPSAWLGLRCPPPGAGDAGRDWGLGGCLHAGNPAGVDLSGWQRVEGAAGGGAGWSLGGKIAEWKLETLKHRECQQLACGKTVDLLMQQRMKARVKTIRYTQSELEFFFKCKL